MINANFQIYRVLELCFVLYVFSNYITVLTLGYKFNSYIIKESAFKVQFF
jgi:hypothetical protein